ncbi:hypothetical protein ACFFK0_09545 [Paenibacillus chartarius]|uniref:Transposase n=1 Tax=Paenibacillus chartarius TaxID=747481 RepID=A0ABV6DJB4_9BACL
MTIFVGLAALAAVFLLLLAHWVLPPARYWIEGLAFVSAYLFGVIAAVYTGNVLINGTVMMTDIHHIFLNPLFLTAGAYLGVYAMYKIALAWWKLWRA